MFPQAIATLDSLTNRIQLDFGLTPITASEIEFYMLGATASGQLETFWQSLSTACQQSALTIYSKGAESGTDQFEVALAPTSPTQTVKDAATLQSLITTISASLGFPASFAAKPYTDQPGSGLHLHISLNDTNGKNTFFKNDHEISPQLKHSIGGLIAWLPDCMPIFAPTPASYARFTPKSNAPNTISWGANNRTTAIRLPDAAHDNKHIELRVAGADANPAQIMAILLAATHYGLKNQSNPGPQTYTDATLETATLPKLPATPEEATSLFRNSPKIKEYFPELLSPTQ